LIKVIFVISMCPVLIPRASPLIAIAAARQADSTSYLKNDDYKTASCTNSEHNANKYNALAHPVSILPELHLAFGIVHF